MLAIIQYRSSVTFIAQLMGVSWGALAGAFLAPFLYGLYWKKATSAACWASFLFSTVVMLSNIFVGSRFPALLQSPINAGAFCMLAGLVIVPVVSLFTRKPDRCWWRTPSPATTSPVIVAQREGPGRLSGGPSADGFDNPPVFLYHRRASKLDSRAGGAKGPPVRKVRAPQGKDNG